jgi:hypothetical protein
VGQVLLTVDPGGGRSGGTGEREQAFNVPKRNGVLPASEAERSLGGELGPHLVVIVASSMFWPADPPVIDRQPARTVAEQGPGA